MVDRQVAIVTGASSGIGFEVVRGLARADFRVIAHGRSADRIREARASLTQEFPQAAVEWFRADFSDMAQVRQAAEEIGGLTGRIDVLVNNAGQLLDSKIVTVDGFEQTFAGNVLAPFLLTSLLTPLLEKSKSPHVIQTSSAGHSYVEDMRWDDLQLEQDFDASVAYLQSKLANLILARECARRLAAKGIVSSAVHPGTVQSRFTETADERTKAYFRAAAATGDLSTPEQGADTIIWLACRRGNALPSGGYFSERQRVEPSLAAQNPTSGPRLWKACADLLGLPGGPT
ncbi:SDR family NAD(P)-dependent oxidoreductase [Novosphingobium sp. PASSN1]|uniref:SDR family NAD(P)-dependent oxidoreductase n=1 Tax=Novosphingobium sp. PASSN1 TaxID=2015561 RepID=UPI000BC43698|nr:SDR family NAD(P)-dependent oxidoreductase [Novosphingobium sp. PASSN1]OYU34796.1 MAG: short-chain dehydrogenase [Novosphingobium sp. PASSN1]